MAIISPDYDYELSAELFTHPIYSPYQLWINRALAHKNEQLSSAELLNILIEKYTQNFSNFNQHKLKFSKQILLPKQAKKSVKYYERIINEDGEIPTRSNNWHDFFNALCWLTFPKIKATISHLHFCAINNYLNLDEQASNIRGGVRDLLTLFDEGGVMVVINNKAKINFEKLIKNHQWRELFWDNREQLITDVKFIIIGHAILDKVRNPYSGITAKALFSNVENNIFTNPQELITYLDINVAEKLINQNNNLNTKLLCPLPIFGYPTWFEGNDQLEFYNNIEVFRPHTFTRKKNL